MNYPQILVEPDGDDWQVIEYPDAYTFNVLDYGLDRDIAEDRAIEIRAARVAAGRGVTTTP
jgi:hypothetical protein